MVGRNAIVSRFATADRAAQEAAFAHQRESANAAERRRADSILNRRTVAQLSTTPLDELRRLVLFATDSGQATARARSTLQQREQELRFRAIVTVVDRSVDHDGYRCSPSPQRVREVLDRAPEFPDLEIAAIACRSLWIGMSASQLELSWGWPHRVNRSTTASGTNEQWVYEERGYVYVDGGFVRSFQTSR